jgi:DNA phosphorothioation-dependent restriction protein DptG
MYDLIDVIKQDCKTWEQINNKRNLFDSYMYINECNDSKKNGLYQLILNGCELWYGTLQEINAVVKSMIKINETNNFIDV